MEKQLLSAVVNSPFPRTEKVGKQTSGAAPQPVRHREFDGHGSGRSVPTLRLDTRPLVDSERVLVVAAQRGDVEAFEILVQRHHKRVFGLAYRMLSDRGDAEDVVQDTLVAAWRRLPTLSEPAAFAKWLNEIAT